MKPPLPHVVARALLVAASVVCAVGMVGPFQGLEEALVPWDKAAHFIAFYGLTALLYVSFPRNRRVDLTCLVILAGAGVELLQALTGRDADVGDIAANALGSIAVLAPSFIEPIRAYSRAPWDRPFDRRRASARADRRADGLPELEPARAESRASP